MQLPSSASIKAPKVGGDQTFSPSGDVFPPLPPGVELANGGGEKSFLGRVVQNAEDLATGLLPGAIETVKAPALDVAGLFKGDADFNRTRDLVFAVGKGMVEDLKHPLRNPINTALTLGSVLSFGAGTAARVAAASRALEASGAAADVARAAAFGPRASELRRVVRVEGKAPVQAGSYSRSALTRAIQRGVDTLRETYPERRFPVRTQEQRYGRALAKKEYVNPQRIERAAANEIQFLFKRLTGPEVRAIQLYAENIPNEIRSKFHQKVLDAARLEGDKVLARKNERILQLDEVANARYVRSLRDDAGNLIGVEWRPGKQSEKLKAIFDRTNEIVKKREDDLVQAGLRSRAGLETREQSIGAVYTGARLYTAKDDAELRAEAEKAIAANDEKIGKLKNDLTSFLQKNLRKPEAAVATARRKAGTLVSGGGAANVDLRARQAELSALKRKYQKADAAREELAAKIPLFYLVDSVLNGTEDAASSLEKIGLEQFGQRRSVLESQRGDALRSVTEALFSLDDASLAKAVFSSLTQAKSAVKETGRSAREKARMLRIAEDLLSSFDTTGRIPILRSELESAQKQLADAIAELRANPSGAGVTARRRDINTARDIVRSAENELKKEINRQIYAARKLRASAKREVETADAAYASAKAAAAGLDQSGLEFARYALESARADLLTAQKLQSEAKKGDKKNASQLVKSAEDAVASAEKSVVDESNRLRSAAGVPVGRAGLSTVSVGQAQRVLLSRLAAVRKIEKDLERVDAEKAKALQSNLAEVSDWRSLHRDLSEAVDTHNQLIEVLHGIQTEISFVDDLIRSSRQSNKDVARKIINDAVVKLEKAKEEHRAIVGARVLTLKALRDNNSTLVARIDESARNVGKFIGGSGDFVARMYTPQGYDQALRSVFQIAGIGPKGVVGMPKRPRWLTKPYTGATTRLGTNRLDLGNALAERIHEGVRFIYLLKFRNALLSMASDTPKGIKDPVAIRLTAKPVAGLEQVFQKVQDNIKLSRDERDMLGQAFGEFQKELFDEELGKRINIDEWQPDPNIKWISKDMLGGLDLPSPMATLDKGGVKVALRRIDDLNNLTKFVTLYLRPATVVPNVLGNTALMLVQQGFFAPVNMANAVKLIWGMKPGTKMILDQFIGEGRMAQLSAEGGVGAGLLSRGAEFFGKFQDLPFRRAAFLHEARREGYRTSRDVERLLTDPELRDTLYAVSDRANKAMIDYQDLSNFEKSVLRRVFYFYPWVRGATRYTVQFPFESPGTAMVGAQVAKIGAEEERKKFGELPFWARGLVQVGERNGFPLTVQTQNILPFTTGVESLQALTGLFGAGRGPSPVLGNLSPATQATLQMLTGRTTLGYPVPKGQMPIETFGRSIAEATPLGSALKNAIEGTAGRTYPTSTMDMILQYLVSQTFAPRPTDVGRLQSIKASESSQ